MCAAAAAAVVVTAATTASKMTMQRLANDISSKADLPGKKVRTVLGQPRSPLPDTYVCWCPPLRKEGLLCGLRHPTWIGLKSGSALHLVCPDVLPRHLLFVLMLLLLPVVVSGHELGAVRAAAEEVQHRRNRHALVSHLAVALRWCTSATTTLPPPTFPPPTTLPPPTLTPTPLFHARTKILPVSVALR